MRTTACSISASASLMRPAFRYAWAMRYLAVPSVTGSRFVDLPPHDEASRAADTRTPNRSHDPLEDLIASAPPSAHGIMHAPRDERVRALSSVRTTAKGRTSVPLEPLRSVERRASPLGGARKETPSPCDARDPPRPTRPPRGPHRSAPE